MFTRLEVIVLTNKHTNTNKQTLLKTSNALRYAMTLSNNNLELSASELSTDKMVQYCLMSR